MWRECKTLQGTHKLNRPKAEDESKNETQSVAKGSEQTPRATELNSMSTVGLLV